MPIYPYLCKCGHEDDHYAKIDEQDIPCPKCSGKMTRQFHGNFGINMGVGAYGYYDDNLQTYLHSNAHKRQVMAEQGVSEGYGKGWR